MSDSDWHEIHTSRWTFQWICLSKPAPSSWKLILRVFLWRETFSRSGNFKCLLYSSLVVLVMMRVSYGGKPASPPVMILNDRCLFVLRTQKAVTSWNNDPRSSLAARKTSRIIPVTDTGWSHLITVQTELNLKRINVLNICEGRWFVLVWNATLWIFGRKVHHATLFWVFEPFKVDNFVPKFRKDRLLPSSCWLDYILEGVVVTFEKREIGSTSGIVTNQSYGEGARFGTELH